MIIGITGTNGAGKGTLAENLKEKGFAHYSVRGYLENILIKEGKTTERKNLIDLANKIKAENSPSYIAEQLYLEAKNSGIENVIIESIRTPGEISALKKLGEFYLLAVDADPKLRYERIFTRAISPDKLSYDDFIALEQQEMTSKDPNKQNISACMLEADYIIQNDGNLQELIQAFSNPKSGFTSLIGETKRRPSFNEIFMRQAYEWGMKSSCLRRSVGAVIAKENTLLSEGYNGPARGSPHCEELGGCLRQQLNIPSGEQDEICRAVHAEPNAILNCETKSARQGATMFSTVQPCTYCARVISNSGISEVVYHQGYAAPKAIKILMDAKVKVTKYSGVTPKGFARFFG